MASTILFRNKIAQRRPRHRITSEPRLIRRFGVADKFFHRRVSAVRHNLVCAASVLGVPTASRLAQPMRAATPRQSGGVAPFAEALTEMIAAIGFAGRGEEQQIGWIAAIIIGGIAGWLAEQS
jgi:hypothetical protein